MCVIWTEYWIVIVVLLLLLFLFLLLLTTTTTAAELLPLPLQLHYYTTTTVLCLVRCGCCCCYCCSHYDRFYWIVLYLFVNVTRLALTSHRIETINETLSLNYTTMHTYTYMLAGLLACMHDCFNHFDTLWLNCNTHKFSFFIRLLNKIHTHKWGDGQTHTQ